MHADVYFCHHFAPLLARQRGETVNLVNSKRQQISRNSGLLVILECEGIKYSRGSYISNHWVAVDSETVS